MAKVASLKAVVLSSGSDAYTGAGTIHVPFLSVAEAGAPYGVFTNVEVAGVSLGSPPILSPGGGMPAAMDTWDLATAQWTIGGIVAGSFGFFTNPILDLDFKSGASLPYIQSVGLAAPAHFAPGIFLIDGTATLRSFDPYGQSIASVHIGNISNIDGGGITTDANNVYVTVGFPQEVLAFNKVTLAPVALRAGAFSNLNTPRGITYDSANQWFYVGNGGSNVGVYDAKGGYLYPITQNVYGPSGVAYDVLSQTIWVANYTGGSGNNPGYAISEFNGDGSSAQTLNAATTFRAPLNATVELPYSIAYCQPQYTSTTGTFGPTYIAVGYFSDNSGFGRPELGIYNQTGSVVATVTPQLTSQQQPNSLACSSTGTIYAATNAGLVLYSTSGTQLATPAGLQGLQTPIYGVHVTY